MPRNKPFEESAADRAADRRGAKNMGVSPEEYEGSPDDVAEDAEMQKHPGQVAAYIGGRHEEAADRRQMKNFNRTLRPHNEARKKRDFRAP